MWLMEHNPKIDWCMGDISDEMPSIMQAENHRGERLAKLHIS